MLRCSRFGTCRVAVVACAVTILALLAACGSDTPPPRYSVGGTVSGLAGTGLALQDNGGDDLNVAANGAFTFSVPVVRGATYAVTVKTQPRLLAQTCTVSAGSGAVGATPVTAVRVECVTPTPRFAYVTQQARNTVTAYAIDGTTGALIDPPVGSWATGTVPVSVAIDPLRRFLYVANYNANSVSAYTLDTATGALASVPGSPFSTGAGPYLVTVDPAGRFAYVADSDSNNISAYAIDPGTGALSEIPGSPFAAGDGSRSFQLAPSGKLGYGTAPTQVLVYGVNAATGALSPAGSISPVSGGGGISLAMDPGGRFLYAPNYQWADPTYVSAFALNAATGAPAEVTGSPFQADGGAGWAVVEPAGRYAYVANLASSTVAAYSINQATGALTRIASYPAGSTSSVFVAADPSGRFVYVGNNWGTVSGYAIDSGTGALTAITGSPFRLPSQSGYGIIAIAILAR